MWLQLWLIKTDAIFAPAASVSSPNYEASNYSHTLEIKISALFFFIKGDRGTAAPPRHPYVLAHIWRQNKQQCKSHTHFAQPLITPRPTTPTAFKTGVYLWLCPARNQFALRVSSLRKLAARATSFRLGDVPALDSTPLGWRITIDLQPAEPRARQ